MNDLIFEGGYAAYVWPAYAITAVSLTLLASWVIATYRSAKAGLARVEAEREKRLP